MKEEVKKNLETFKLELHKLMPAIEHLQIADKNATELIKSFTEIQDLYNKHLDSIEKLLVLSNNKHQLEIRSMINISTTKLDDVIKNSSDSYSEIEKGLRNSLENYSKLSEETNNLVLKIDSIDFPKRLESIESGFTELLDIQTGLKSEIDNSINRLDKQIENVNFNKKIGDIQKEVSKAVGSNDKVIKDLKELDIPGLIKEHQKIVIEKVKESNNISNNYVSEIISDLKKNTTKISLDTTKSVTDLNLPIRIDKLDANIAGIISLNQNIQSRTDTLERNLIDKIKDTTEKQHLSQLSFQEAVFQRMFLLEQKIENITVAQKKYDYITWFLIILGFIIILVARSKQ